MKKKKSINQILITSSTLSSAKVIKKFKFNKTVHQFYPVDHFLFTNKFLQYWKPSLAMFIDSEIWPHMFKKINDKNIPLVLLNARITKKTFKRWIKIKQFSNSVFNKISVALPQNLETRNFLKKLSVKKINLIGNLKFAENHDENLSNINKSLKYEFKKKNVWVALTHSKKNYFVSKLTLNLKKKKKLTTIIIPRHIHRTKK